MACDYESRGFFGVGERMTEVPEGYKRCSKCGEVKPVEEFYKHKTGRYGVGSICKKCTQKKEKENYKKNKPRILAYQEEYRNEHKEKIRTRNKIYHQKNKEKLNKKSKEDYEKNKERYSEYKKEYYKKNKDLIIDRYTKYYEKNKDQILEYHIKYNMETGYGKKYSECVKNPSCPAVGGRGAEFVILTCPICGEEFRKQKSNVDWFYQYRGQTVFYCSRGCSSEAQRKSHKSEYEKNIKRIRKEQRL
jgi:hypothetical protein